MAIWNSILNRLNTSFYKDTGNRMDKDAQADIRNDLDKGKSISIKNIQSSRWTKEGDTKEYTSDELAKENAEPETETSVSSTAVKSVRYNPKTQELRITYVGGNKEYSFPNVPKEVVTEFLESPSKGKYLAHYIKPNYGV